MKYSASAIGIRILHHNWLAHVNSTAALGCRGLTGTRTSASWNRAPRRPARAHRLSRQLADAHGARPRPVAGPVDIGRASAASRSSGIGHDRDAHLGNAPGSLYHCLGGRRCLRRRVRNRARRSGRAGNRATEPGCRAAYRSGGQYRTGPEEVVENIAGAESRGARGAELPDLVDSTLETARPARIKKAGPDDRSRRDVLFRRAAGAYSGLRKSVAVFVNRAMRGRVQRVWDTQESVRHR